jgi:lipid-A-disaccharide synthase
MANKTKKLSKILISAGDYSGDIHAARLINSLKKLQPELEFIGVGGPNMEKEGFVSLTDFEKISVVGLTEVIKNIRAISSAMKAMKKEMLSGNVDALILVDYPGFNLKMAKFAKKLGIPTIYYIAPQLWAWGKNRAKKIADTVDLLLVVFPFEVDYFGKFGIKAEFVGHPLFDDPAFALGDETQKEKLITFLPGSRKQELKRHIPLLYECAKLLKSKREDIGISMAIPPHLDNYYRTNFPETINIWELTFDARESMKRSMAGVVKTGTSTLEALLLDMPFVMYYLTSPLTFYLGEKVVNLDYISLANILAGKEIIRELIQKDAKPESIVNEVIKIIENKEEYERIRSEFDNIKTYLGRKGSSGKAASLIFEFLDK